MITKDDQLELMRRCLDGEASDEEFAQLEELLRNDAGFRKDYLSYLNIDSALSALPNLEEEPEPSKRSLVSLPQWRPLAIGTAAAFVFGLFCATLTWAIVVPRKAEAPSPPAARVVIPILTESFEGSTARITEGFPSQTGEWGGDRAQIVDSTSSHQALDGNSVLKLESSPESKLSYLQQIIDVSSLPHPQDGELRVVEVIASFLADQPGQRERYTLRVASFKESPEDIGGLWEGVLPPEMDEITLTYSKTGVTTQAKATGWKTLSTMLEVPADANCVVISLAAGRRYLSPPKTPHYLDDIRAELRIIPFSQRLNSKIK